MSERSYDGPPIDATEQHISERPEVEYATDPEPEGTMTTDLGLPDHVEPSNESQRKVLEAAANPVRNWGSCDALSQDVVPEKSRGYAGTVLRRKWPEKYESIKHREGESGGGEKTEEVTEIRKRLLTGATAADLAEEFGVCRSTINKWARGTEQEQSSKDSPLPPVGYDREAGEYRPIEDPSEQLEIEIGREGVDAETLESVADDAKAAADAFEKSDDPTKPPTASHDDSGRNWRRLGVVGIVAVVLWWLIGGRQ